MFINHWIMIRSCDVNHIRCYHEQSWKNKRMRTRWNSRAMTDFSHKNEINLLMRLIHLEKLTRQFDTMSCLNDWRVYTVIQDHVDLHRKWCVCIVVEVKLISQYRTRSWLQSFRSHDKIKVEIRSLMFSNVIIIAY